MSTSHCRHAADSFYSSDSFDSSDESVSMFKDLLKLRLQRLLKSFINMGLHFQSCLLPARPWRKPWMCAARAGLSVLSSIFSIVALATRHVICELCKYSQSATCFFIAAGGKRFTRRAKNMPATLESLPEHWGMP